MALAPVSKLKKQEIIWLASHKCKHNHTYLDHYSCFMSEIAEKYKWEPGSNIPIPHRIGFFDIESTGFQGDFSIMLCYSIKDSESDKIYSDCVTAKDLKGDLDKRILINCIRDMKIFDRIVGFYSSKFDLPFCRTRAVYWNLNFPKYSELLHTDVYYIIRHKFKLSRNRQQTAHNILVGNETRKTHFGRDAWIKSMTGDKKSLDYILDHNKKDVLDLEELYYKVIDFSRKTNTSI
jgi:uncharacterized protein YprB with RNaseH-like and TPR domain